MAAGSKPEKTALQTGLRHGAISLGVVALAGAIFAGAVQMMGDENAGSPEIAVNLFADRPGATPILKARIEESGDHGEATTHHASSTEHVSSDESHDEPTLQVDSPDGADHGVTIRHGVENASDDGSSVTITRASTTETKIASAEEVRKPLPKSPIAGFYERGPVGLLPRKDQDGRTPAEIYARPHVAGEKPQIALIVGGLGLKTSLTLQAIRDLPPEVTLSFVPYSSRLQTFIDAARKAGHEVLLELPMEPYDYPNVDTGPETLLTSATDEENARRLSILMGKATGYFGVINYQGAKLATDSRALTPIMGDVQDRGLAFFHDGGSPRSVFPSIAETLQMSFSEADRIVDTRPTPDAIDRNLLHLEALALQNGRALGVGFAYPVTVDQFQQWADTLEYRGYELVPASVAAGVTAIEDNSGS